MAKKKSEQNEPKEVSMSEYEEIKSGEESKPKEVDLDDSTFAIENVEGSVPVMTPPGEIETQNYSSGFTAWHNSQKINALWCINQNRNSFVRIVGVGWKKLANNSDTGIVSLTMLASHAKEMQSNINYREETDKKIHELYVW